MHRRSWLALVIASTLLSGCTLPKTETPASSTQYAATLAPTGQLRVGVYLGSPTSLVVKADGSLSGVSYEMGQLLAKKLGVPINVVKFERIAQVIEKLETGDLDFTVTNASSARAQVVTFTSPIIDLELGYLAAPNGKIQRIDQVDQPGSHIGVSRGSSSYAALSKKFKFARISQFDSLSAAAEALQQNQIDAFATNKGILFELAEKVPGSHVMDGRWGLEHMAIGIPKGREQALPDLEKFVRDMQQTGTLTEIIARSGLRGTIDATP